MISEYWEVGRVCEYYAKQDNLPYKWHCYMTNVNLLHKHPLINVILSLYWSQLKQATKSEIWKTGFN